MSHLQATGYELNNPFWQRAGEIYAINNIAPLLLQLQDQYQLNVCFILWLLWLEESSVYIDLPNLNEAKQLASRFEKKCIIPVRKSRRAQKELALNDVIYQQTKSLELALEQELIAILYRFSKNHSLAENSTLKLGFMAAIQSLYRPEQQAIAQQIYQLTRT
ncbi:MAG: TIGR02444 family protein [Pseudomonadales bacterium]|nr:TIGR02444 family protein [Pseudomonadales bacterium]